MSNVNITLNDTNAQPLKDIPQGSYFISKGNLYLKIHHVRSSMGEVPSLTVVLPNFDHTDELKVRSACVKVEDGAGYYFPEVMQVVAVKSINITAEV
jgi:hypothetical protein